jgi:hypothetical protein
MNDKVGPTAKEEDAAVASALQTLRAPSTIRERCNELLALAQVDQLPHFKLHEDRLPLAVEFVCETMSQAYPQGRIPFHSRWRHFAPDGKDRWQALAAQLTQGSPAERARSAFDCVITSVLLDAGAGNEWQYVEAQTGQVFNRSEGLAIASLDLFASGAFSANAHYPLRVDAEALEGFTEAKLAAVFQVTEANPLVGLAGRTKLLQALGACLNQHSDFFGAEARLGHLFDYMKREAVDDTLPASVILEIVLTSIGAIWPGRLSLGAQNLGDVWRHNKLKRSDMTDGLVPFHKLSQWLSYSLIEPLTAAGIKVTGLDALTGLAEYRNGGLFVDLDILTLKDASQRDAVHDIGSELVVEWRALTVALLERLALGVREKLALDAVTLPLVKVLEGGTWSAGRRLAYKRSPDGAPPILISSDGTVF